MRWGLEVRYIEEPSETNLKKNPNIDFGNLLDKSARQPNIERVC
jgi:hypothetical protein